MSPVELGKALKGLDKYRDENILVGFGTADDASVYKLDGELCLLQTLDFFTPVVDDPYLFGQISAANSLSDIYAMGGKPLTALNVVCFPKKLGMDVLNQILKGGMDKAHEAGIVIAGGHTVDDEEPKYGLSVTGIVKKEDMISNSTAKEGDILILTKPLGSGVLTTALKKGIKNEEDIREIIEVMSQLNKGAAEIMLKYPVSACTDVTGFGFLGHLSEMTKASNLRGVIINRDVPMLEEAIPLCRDWKMPGGSFANIEFLKGYVEVEKGVDEGRLNCLYDAQTSGGLIIAIDEEHGKKMVEELKNAGYNYTSIVGFLERGSGILVK